MRFSRADVVASLAVVLHALTASAGAGATTTADAAAWPAGATRNVLWLQIVNGGALPARVLEATLDEARAIWEQYGIEIRWGSGPAARPSEIPLLIVIDESKPTRTRRVLGSLHFIDGRADDTLRLLPAHASALLSEITVASRRYLDLAPMVQHALLGRALGRALAHELGHYLLDSPGHTEHGLMKRRFATPELIAPTAARFALDAVDVLRMQQRVAAVVETRRPRVAALSF